MAGELGLPIKISSAVDTPSTNRYNIFLNSADADIPYKKDSVGLSTPLVPTIINIMTTRGDMLYRNSLNVTARLPVGAAGTFLSSDGTDVSWAAVSGAVTSVSGTTNRITSTGGATPVIDISASYVGQSSITTLGTIGTGVWQGTVVGKAYGGTGVNIATTALTLGTASSVVGSMVLQNATNANTITIQSGVTTSSHTLTLPVANASGVLTNNGSGTLTWATASSGITVGTTTSNGTNGRLLFSLSSVVNESASVYIDQSGVDFNVKLGNHIGTSSTGNVIVGYWANYNNSTTLGNSVIIGDAACGPGSSVNSIDNVFIGYSAGNNAGNQAFTTAIGYQAGYGSTVYRGIYYGHNAGYGNGFQGIIIGFDPPTLTAAHQCIIGSNDSNGYIDNYYLNGVTHTAAYSTTINATGGSGTNNAGASLTLAGGKSTGSAAGGSLLFKTSTTLGSGTTAQTLVTRLTLSGGAVTTDASTATWADALDFVFGSTTGTKIGTATTQKLAFYNSTPIVQPTTAVATSVFVANTSGIVDDSATFGGYKISQIVKALQTLGLLA